MATFKATILRNNVRLDKTWNVVIRFTHNRKCRYLPTTMFVSKNDLTTSFKLKNQQVIDKCEELILTYRKQIAPLNLEISDMDIDTIVKYLRKKKDENGLISFSDFFDKWKQTHSDMKGLKNYITAYNSFKSFLGHGNIFHNEITEKTLRTFCEYLSDKPRAQSLYTSSIVRIFNDMRNYYNDEDNGIIRIKQTLSRFEIPKQNIAEKRALTIDEVRNLFLLPYNNIKVRGKSSRHDLALDCFKLSFCLMGMNSADLFNATEYDGEYITYNRTKTKDRRNDKAKMVVRVHPAIKHLIVKYRGKERVFNFYERFSSMQDFNRALNIGLKEVGKAINVYNLQFYSARHSFATIAVNDVGIPIYIVNDMLCHIDRNMKTTMLYIKKIFAPMNEANFKLLDFVLPF